MLYLSITEEVKSGILSIIERCAKEYEIEFKCPIKDAVEFKSHEFSIDMKKYDFSPTESHYFDEDDFLLAVSDSTQDEYGLFWFDTEKNLAKFEFIV